MKYFKKIIGKKVYLSPVDIDDCEQYAQWINDPEISINLDCFSQVFSLIKEREALEKLSKENSVFAIVENNSNKLIGNCGLHNIDFINRKAVLGIFIGDKNFWNRGFGTEAVNLLLDYGFNALNLNSVMLVVKEFNKRAIKCYEKCGFKTIGSRREASIVAGGKYDEIMMDILAGEFTENLSAKYINN
ncbi:GNAT family N-acetyltransferase [candidate division WOR-3 bacterium]|nr:GNAT family N-acetyltransferase [candidate division WOR-3 bacterium]